MTNQLWRGPMLAKRTESRDHAGAGTVVVLALTDDEHADEVCEGASKPLREPRRRLVRASSLEELVDAALREPGLEYWGHLMTARYFNPV